MTKVYGWYSPSQAHRGVYIYLSLDGKSEMMVTEATSRADYTPLLSDTKSLGELGRFIRPSSAKPGDDDGLRGPGSDGGEPGDDGGEPGDDVELDALIVSLGGES